MLQKRAITTNYHNSQVVNSSRKQIQLEMADDNNKNDCRVYCYNYELTTKKINNSPLLFLLLPHPASENFSSSQQKQQN